MPTCPGALSCVVITSLQSLYSLSNNDWLLYFFAYSIHSEKSALFASYREEWCFFGIYAVKRDGWYASAYGTPSPPKIDFYYVPIARAPIHHDRTDCPKSHRSDSAHVHRSAEIAKRFQYSVLRSPYRTAQQLPIPLASTERIFAYRFDEIDRMCAYRFPKS